MEFKEYIAAKLNRLVLSIFERKVSVPMKVQMLPDNTVSLIFYIGDKIESARGKTSIPIFLILRKGFVS